MSELYGGVETGGTWCVCAIGRGPDQLERTEQFHTGEPEATVERIADFFRVGPAIAALGVGAFGPLDLRRDSATWGYVTTTPKPGWQHVALAPLLRERLGVPVAFDLDVTAAALAEQRWGAGRGRDSVCYLTVGTGIGAGLIAGGRPWHGLIHPEVGHLRIPHDGEFAGICPVHGDCWEGLASGPALAARWGESPEHLPEDHPAWALEAEHLALGIHSIVSVVSPELVIAGGGVLERPGLLAMVAARLRGLNAGYLDSPLLNDRVDEFLVSPALGDSAGVLGAIALAMDAENP